MPQVLYSPFICNPVFICSLVARRVHVAPDTTQTHLSTQAALTAASSQTGNFGSSLRVFFFSDVTNTTGLLQCHNNFTSSLVL